ncbi:helix-turn-helix transcriptional regulator [Leifsonia aquatica]|uniref:helix-turn-helix transcriptional regulator n=1 Tax=Leifsonia aquatica TaxID=144185 RepID=UPI0028A72B40|nr:LuxR C-terminal-related transcriptional regulator [Leifsonia aquatica]
MTPSGTAVVDRRGLRRVLDEGEGRAAVVSIVASGGTGKTSLLRAWCDLEPADRVLVEVDGPPRAGGAGDRDWRDRISALRDHAGRATTVIDGIERISSHSDRELLQEAVAAADSAIVLSGRTQPLALDALSPERPLIMVGVADLAFGQREADELLRSAGVLLPPQDVFELLDRTGGRAMTLTLAVAALARMADPSEAIHRLAHSPAGADEYFVSALLGTLDPAEAELLLSLSAVPSFSVGLAAELTGCPDAGTTVERLRDGNDLVQRIDGGEEGCEYRFDESLRRTLFTELSRRDARRVDHLRRTAARWYLAGGDVHDGLALAVASRSTDLVEEILRRHGLGMVFSGDTAPVRDALAALEDRGVMSGTTGLLAALVTSPTRFDSVRTDHFLALAEDEAARSPEAELVLASILGLRADDDGQDARDRALTRIENAVRLSLRRPAGEGGALAVLDARIFAEAARASLLLRSGRVTDALAVAEAAAASAEETGLPWLQMLCLELAAGAAASRRSWPMVHLFERRIAGLAGAEPRTDSIVAASALLRAASAAYQSCEPFRSAHVADIVQARWRGLDTGDVAAPRALHLLFRLDEEEDTRTIFEEMEHLFSVSMRRNPRTIATGAFRFLDLTMHYRGRAAVRGLVDELEQMLGARSLEAALGGSIVREGTVTQDADDRTLELLLHTGAPAWHGSNIVFGWLLLAAHAAERDREDLVQARLMEALSVAERTGTRRPFLARGGTFARLVSDRVGGFGECEEFARSVLAAAGALHDRVDGPENSPMLTAKERELLRELPLHQSIGQIAAKHSVSANTVKTHLRSIYAKLDARDRAHAVDNARALGLL